jgi:hypothetical protein
MKCPPDQRKGWRWRRQDRPERGLGGQQHTAWAQRGDHALGRVELLAAQMMQQAPAVH